MSYNGTGVLHVAKESGVEREVDILPGERIMISVLSFYFVVSHAFLNNNDRCKPV